MTHAAHSAAGAKRPPLGLEEAAAARLHAAYSEARVILEYGGGGSTVLAAELPGKYIMCVESDPNWALKLQLWIDAAVLPSPVIVYPVDIGPVGAWGRPKDATAWASFHRYPLAIWDEPFFRHPDVILIDGRFRPACLATAALRITRPVTVLFDDYVPRTHYHAIEVLARPVAMIGRMAEFRLEPGALPRDAVTTVVAAFAQASYASGEARKFDAFA